MWLLSQTHTHTHALRASKFAHRFMLICLWIFSMQFAPPTWIIIIQHRQLDLACDEEWCCVRCRLPFTIHSLFICERTKATEMNGSGMVLKVSHRHRSVVLHLGCTHVSHHSSSSNKGRIKCFHTVLQTSPSTTATDSNIKEQANDLYERSTRVMLKVHSSAIDEKSGD